MEHFEVQITDEALSDMDEIYRHIAEKLRSPENALRQYNRIADEILSLDMFPKRYRLVDFEPERSEGMHRMLVDNYSVFYVIRQNRVIVTNVLYSASDIERRLKDRKLNSDQFVMPPTERGQDADAYVRELRDNL